MARPKSYTDEEIINIATQLSAKGKKPTGWRIKEILARGKISSIQANLDRLIKDGKVPEEISEQTQDNEISNGRPLPSSFELPVEIQEMLTIKEQALCQALREITISVNDKAHIHYETLMNVRSRELEAVSATTEKAREAAEQDSLDMEERLRKQVEQNERFEENVEALEARLLDSKNEKSELVQTISQLTNSLSKAAENAENQQNTITELGTKLSGMETAHAEVTVELNHTIDEVGKLQSNISVLSGQYEETKEQLIETSTRLESTQGALNKSEGQLSTLRDENSELSAQHCLLENNLRDSESSVVTLTQDKKRLEEQMAKLMERDAPQRIK